jgi:type I restriction enzyme M protein
LIDDYTAELKNQRLDYDIFMAIANDIGYDATGKDTKVYELEPIATALREFITDIEAGRA